jgi:hypothetical protein
LPQIDYQSRNDPQPVKVLAELLDSNLCNYSQLHVTTPPATITKTDDALGSKANAKTRSNATEVLQSRQKRVSGKRHGTISDLNESLQPSEIEAVTQTVLQE